MCVKEFDGYICGHCSIPVIRKCPTAEANPQFPPCSIPAERPNHLYQFCHPCSRVKWNIDVLLAENDHKKLHREGRCSCETVFPHLDDVEVTPLYNWAQTGTSATRPQHLQPQFVRAQLMAVYPGHHMNSSNGMLRPEYGPQYAQTEADPQSPGGWAKQYVHDHPNEHLYYDDAGNIFLFNQGNLNDYFIELPRDVRDIRDNGPIPAGEKNGAWTHSGAWVRNDFIQLDHINLRYGDSPPAHVMGHQSQYGLQQNEVSSPGFGVAGPSNYACSNAPAPSLGPQSPYGFQNQYGIQPNTASAPGFAVPGASSYNNAPAFVGQAPFGVSNDINVVAQELSHLQAQGHRNLTIVPMLGPIVQPQRPVGAYIANRGYGGGRYRTTMWGIGTRYYPNQASPSSAPPGRPTQAQNIRSFSAPVRGSNIEVVAQLENLNISSRIAQNLQQPVSRGVSDDLEVISAADVQNVVSSPEITENTNNHQSSVITAPNSPEISQN